ncbi:YraN family protein [Sneathiella limimaris]|uniref:YraN family protein n=1 Tax=Sneathiella limimaris TaxID=1964213 RepID=UPI00146B6895|nr:YraN family protein [Sneathiella limimaris]
MAETYVQYFLRLKGYRILRRRYKKPFGEIDLVVQKGNVLIAVEVKMRPDIERAKHAIGPIQQRRIRKALASFVAENPKYSAFDLRLDFIVVTSFLRLPYHLENAW